MVLFLSLQAVVGMEEKGDLDLSLEFADLASGECWRLLLFPGAHPQRPSAGLSPACRYLLWLKAGRSVLWHWLRAGAISPATSRPLSHQGGHSSASMRRSSLARPQVAVPGGGVGGCAQELQIDIGGEGPVCDQTIADPDFF